ncbi:hypothetical protein Tco_1231302, partial [Tanacetum coccineum]
FYEKKVMPWLRLRIGHELKVLVMRVSVLWSNERLLENKELNAIIGAWFTLWRDQS